MEAKTSTGPFRDAPTTAAIFAVFLLFLAGCASELAPTAGSPGVRTPYVGVFTGEFVDERPLYRFPTIEVVGSRRGVTYLLTELDGS